MLAFGLPVKRGIPALSCDAEHKHNLGHYYSWYYCHLTKYFLAAAVLLSPLQHLDTLGEEMPGMILFDVLFLHSSVLFAAMH
jgi:hypothetical protein